MQMDVWRIGPLLLSGERLATVAALWLFLTAAGLLERWSPRPLTVPAWGALIVGLAIARIGYVAGHWDAYRIEPASALYIWQGGFSLGWGLAGAGVCLAAALSGRPLVINLWATWCGPCRREMPMLMEIAPARRDVTFLLLNQGEAAGVVRRYLSASGLPGAHVALDPAADMGRRLGVAGLPLTIFVGADGLVRRTHIGEISRAALDAEVEKIAPARNQRSKAR